jgi:hypothetical protein
MENPRHYGQGVQGIVPSHTVWQGCVSWCTLPPFMSATLQVWLMVQNSDLEDIAPKRQRSPITQLVVMVGMSCLFCPSRETLAQDPLSVLGLVA